MLIFEIVKQPTWTLPNTNYWLNPKYRGYEDLICPSNIEINNPKNWQNDFSKYIQQLNFISNKPINDIYLLQKLEIISAKYGNITNYCNLTDYGNITNYGNLTNYWLDIFDISILLSAYFELYKKSYYKNKLINILHITTQIDIAIEALTLFLSRKYPQLECKQFQIKNEKLADANDIRMLYQDNESMNIVIIDKGNIINVIAGLRILKKNGTLIVGEITDISLIYLLVTTFKQINVVKLPHNNYIVCYSFENKLNNLHYKSLYQMIPYLNEIEALSSARTAEQKNKISIFQTDKIPDTFGNIIVEIFNRNNPQILSPVEWLSKHDL